MQIADRHPEILSGDVFDFVRFIKDDGGIVGQNGAERLLFHREVREKQMVVDDDQIAFERPPVHLRDKAPVELFAFLTGARFAAGIEFPPRAARLSQLPQFAAVPGLGGRLPFTDLLKLPHLFETSQNRFPLSIVKLLAAQIIGPALHVANPQRVLEHRLQERNIFQVQLLLQVLCARRDHHALARENRGNQVRERFADARSRLDDQVPAFVQNRFHGFRHLELARPEFVIRMRARKESGAPEERTGR